MPNRDVPRWTLSRAGIVNVYQYEQETLHFGGGRLLLRGVNGSGKSTAMNMLLPFLIDADPRRIDAAGQQTGVLASWMLNGRDDPQPIGYLWVEFARADEYFVCGCGIRASQRTQRVTTWWFATDQRPGIDYALVEHDVPRTADSLRATLGSGAVYSEDQRSAYKAQVRRTLFGGADLDQHIGLLHVVRSPRVGDQIDRELPERLTAALPELSESAIADAAQPLDDLDDHRRNVEELTRTVGGLAALTSVYQRYARSELRRRATAADELVAVAARRRRAEQDAERAQVAAAEARDAAAALVTDLDTRQRTLHTEVAALRESPAYQQSGDLMALREQVGSLTRTLADADAVVTRRATARAGAAGTVAGALGEVRTDLDDLHHSLDALNALAAATQLSERSPDAPAIVTVQIDGEVEGPAAALDLAPLGPRLTALRAAAQQRSADVDRVRTARRAVDTAERDLADGRRRVTAAETALTAATARQVEARHLYDAAAASWADALDTWLDGLHGIDPDHPSAAAFAIPPRGALLDDRDATIQALRGLLQAVVDDHTTARAALEVRTAEETAAVAAAESSLAELEARSEPDAPRAPWQRATTSIRLADVVDFQPCVDPADRAGLEAALEAAGLLGAEIRTRHATTGGADRARDTGGAAAAAHPAPTSPGDLNDAHRPSAATGAVEVVLETGELLAIGDRAVARPLSDLLVVTVPESATDVDPAGVAAVLASISTSPSDTTDSAVAVDGSFRLGALRGRHHKERAEYIGVTARRELLQRLRAEARSELGRRRALLAATETAAAAERDTLRALADHRRAEPPVRPVDRAETDAAHAEQRALDAQDDLDDRRADVALLDERCGAVEAELRRTGATLHLPTNATELEAIAGQVAQIAPACDECALRATAVARAERAWTTAIDAWRTAVAEHQASSGRRAEVVRELDPLQMRLATLDDAIGLDVDEVLRAIETSEADLRTVDAELGTARADELARATELATRDGELQVARAARAAADAGCVTCIGALRAALAVPGIVAAAQIDPDAPLDLEADENADRLPTVDESVDGLRTLAAALLAQIPEPAAGESTADGVRLSLRARRDQLAAGWDAEDRQPDPDLPLTVDVVGPAVGRVPLAAALTQVSAHLRDQESLLSQKQNQALRNLLQGLIAREVAERLHEANGLVERINARLGTVQTSHGVGVRLKWRQRDDLDANLAGIVGILAKLPDLRTIEEEQELAKSLSAQLDDARRLNGEASYRELIAQVLDYREWYEMSVLVRRAGRTGEETLTRRTPLSEGEKKLVTYLPMFAAVAASCDGLGRDGTSARFLVLDDAFAKVSEDNHAGLFGLLVEFDLDFIATSERLWGTHDTVPELAITEVIRDADVGAILLEHFTWDGTTLHRHDG